MKKTHMKDELSIDLIEAERTVTGMIAVNFEDYPKSIIQSLYEKIDRHAITKSTPHRDILTGETKYFPIRQQRCLIAATYLQLATKQRDFGSLADAWRLLCKINYLTGLEDGREEQKFVPAARGRSEKSEWNKLQFAKLVSEKRPTSGWKRERDAANDILDNAIELNKKLNINLAVGSLADRMTEWMKEDGSAMRAAFQGIYVAGPE